MSNLCKNILIETKNLKYKYYLPGKWILNNINLKINNREFILICGSSGSGKSTLCRTFNGLVPHFHGGIKEGKVFVTGLDVDEKPVKDLFVNIGMVFQNKEAQLFTSSVENEIVFGLESLGLESDEIEERLSSITNLLEIDKLLKRRPVSLSDGEQQIVLIAAILALKPSIIVLDEPFANLDKRNIALVLNAVKKIIKTGISIIICEHRVKDLISLVDRVIVLKKGKVIADNKPGLVFHNIDDKSINIPLSIKLSKLNNIYPHIIDIKKLKNNNIKIYDDYSSISINNHKKDHKMLEIKNISYNIKDFALDNINIDIYSGESLAIIGSNGSGKTTLLKIVSKLLKPAMGEITIDSKNIKKLSSKEIAKKIGMVFQNPNDQFFKYNVIEEIKVGSKILNCFDTKWFNKIVKILKLEELLDRSPYKLSEGEKKRVSFASALITKPKILILDEPTAGQDYYFKDALGDIIYEYLGQGNTIIIVTHDLDFAEKYTNRWILLSQGKIIDDDIPEKIMFNSKELKNAGLNVTDRYFLYKNQVYK